MFTDHMAEATYYDGKWQTAEVNPHSPISFEPSVMALYYGQTVFEGMKAYYVDYSTINLFRSADHFRRFNKSAKSLAMPEVDESLFIRSEERRVGKECRWRV